MKGYIGVSEGGTKASLSEDSRKLGSKTSPGRCNRVTFSNKFELAVTRLRT